MQVERQLLFSGGGSEEFTIPDLGKQQSDGYFYPLRLHSVDYFPEVVQDKFMACFTGLFGGEVQKNEKGKKVFENLEVFFSFLFLFLC